MHALGRLLQLAGLTILPVAVLLELQQAVDLRQYLTFSAFGATVFAVTSGAENVERLVRLGADHVFDRDTQDFSAALRDLTGGRGVDVVVENVGAPTWEKSIRSLARGGRLVTYGATAGPDVQIDIRRLFWRQLSLIGTTMASRSEFEDMLGAAWAGRLIPVIDATLPISEAAAAHERLEAGGHFGKILLVP